MFWNDFNRQNLAMFVRWYIWSFGFCSVAKKYDSQMIDCLSQEHDMVYIHLELLWAGKNKIYIKISKFTM
jgi:hypothetical protein